METAQDARLLFSEGRYSGASNRAYYAMFQIARALLTKHGFDVSKSRTHRGLLRLFSLKLVLTGIVPREAIRAFARASETRWEVDYGVVPLEGRVSQERLEDMEKFIAMAAPLIGDGE